MRDDKILCCRMTRETKLFAFVSTPYTKYAHGIQAAFQLACRETAKLIKAGVPCFSPIAHSHPVAVLGGVDPLAWRLWMDANAPLLACAAVLVVVRADGWQESVGVQAEISWFRNSGRPIFYVDESADTPARLVAFFKTEERHD